MAPIKETVETGHEEASLHMSFEESAIEAETGSKGSMAMQAPASQSRPSISAFEEEMRLPTEPNEDLTGAEFSMDDDTKALLEDISSQACLDPALGGHGYTRPVFMN